MSKNSNRVFQFIVLFATDLFDDRIRANSITFDFVQFLFNDFDLNRHDFLMIVKWCEINIVHEIFLIIDIVRKKTRKLFIWSKSFRIEIVCFHMRCESFSHDKFVHHLEKATNVSVKDIEICCIVILNRFLCVLKRIWIKLWNSISFEKRNLWSERSTKYFEKVKKSINNSFFWLDASLLMKRLFTFCVEKLVDDSFEHSDITSTHIDEIELNVKKMIQCAICDVVIRRLLCHLTFKYMNSTE